MRTYKRWIDENNGMYSFIRSDRGYLEIWYIKNLSHVEYSRNYLVNWQDEINNNEESNHAL